MATFPPVVEVSPRGKAVASLLSTTFALPLKLWEQIRTQ